MEKKIIYTFTGPSASGKNSLVDAIMYLTGNKDLDKLSAYVQEQVTALNKKTPIKIKELVSHTSRAPRDGEVEGINYYYTSAEAIKAMNKIEYSEYAGNLYCLSTKEVNSFAANIGFAVVNAEGVQALKKYAKGKENLEIVSIFIRSNEDICRKRMTARGDKPKDIQIRIDNANKSNEYNGFLLDGVGDIIIENDDLKCAVIRLLRKMLPQI